MRLISIMAAAIGTGLLLATPVSAGRPEQGSSLDGGTPVDTSWSATPPFIAIKAVGPDNVRFTTGERWQVRAEGDPRTLARIRFIIRDGQLTIGRKSGGHGDLKPAKIYVIAPSLHRATIGGSGSLAIDRLTGKKVSATVAGSGVLSIERVSADTLDAAISGSGDLAMSGRSESAKLAIAGSGELRAADLTVDSAEASVAGSGSMAFRSDGKVTAAIVGSGSVAVRGNADCTRWSRVGSGTLTCST
ncbi:head GIN domain-containing protein [Tsuneonella sp. HG249]